MYVSPVNSSRSISKDIISPVLPLIVRTWMTLAIPNPANFPIPFLPSTGLFLSVRPTGSFPRLHHPMLRYLSWHSWKLKPEPLSRMTISAPSPTFSGRLTSTSVASASHALAISSASDATGLWYVWDPSWSMILPWNFSRSSSFLVANYRFPHSSCHKHWNGVSYMP